MTRDFIAELKELIEADSAECHTPDAERIAATIPEWLLPDRPVEVRSDDGYEVQE